MSRLRPAWVAAALLALAGAAQQLTLVVHFARHWVSEDQALLWAAGRDYGRLQFHQPNFWGQRYGVGFEVLPAEVLRRLGMGYQTGLPLGIALMGLAMWWVVGLAAMYRRRVVAGLLAFASPLLLSTEYAFVAVVYNTAAGRLLAATALALAIAWPERTVTWVAVVALGGLALQFDTSSVLIVLPALWFVRHAASTRWHAGARRAVLAALALGAVLPGAWWLLVREWYRRHPDDALHPVPEFRPSLDILRDNVTNPTRHFLLLAPELLRSPVAGVLAIVLLAVAVVRRRRVDVGLLLIGIVAVTLLVLALPRSRDGMPTIYYPMARVLLGLPLALWAVGMALLPPRAGPASNRDDRRTARWAVGILCLVVITVGFRVATWHGRGEEVEKAALLSPTYPLSSAGELVRECARVGQVARSVDARVALYDLRTVAYACAGLDPSLTTVYPPYERRAWVLRAAEQIGSPTLVVVGSTSVTCAMAGLVCEQPADGVRVVHLPGISPLDAVARLGVEIRSFNHRP